MSHEYRTPLNAICGFSELMRDEKFGPIGNGRYREYANDIFESGSHLLGIVNDVLDMAKITAGHLTLRPDWMDVGEVLTLAIKIAGSKVAPWRIAIDGDIELGPVQLYADQRRLKQVMLNLLSNAIKFSPSDNSAYTQAWSGAVTMV